MSAETSSKPKSTISSSNATEAATGVAAAALKSTAGATVANNSTKKKTNGAPLTLHELSGDDETERYGRIFKVRLSLTHVNCHS